RAVPPGPKSCRSHRDGWVRWSGSGVSRQEPSGPTCLSARVVFRRALPPGLAPDVSGITTNPAARGIAASARIAICSGLVAIGLAPFAEGRENTEGPPSLDQVVVTATRLSETLFEANANIS